MKGGRLNRTDRVLFIKPLRSERKGKYNQDEVRELKGKILKEIDFLSDHWVNGDDKIPFSFGGWREEVAESLVKIAKTHADTLLAKKREEMKSQVIQLALDSYHEAQTLSFHVDRVPTSDVNLDKMGEILLKKLSL